MRPIKGLLDLPNMYFRTIISSFIQVRLESNMGLRGVSVIMMVMILLIAKNTNADSFCYARCMISCLRSKQPSSVCVALCRYCGNQVQESLDQHYYCKLDCSLARCAKYSNGMHIHLLHFLYIIFNFFPFLIVCFFLGLTDKNMMETCLDRCSQSNCDIKAPSPS